MSKSFLNDISYHLVSQLTRRKFFLGTGVFFVTILLGKNRTKEVVAQTEEIRIPFLQAQAGPQTLRQLLTKEQVTSVQALIEKKGLTRPVSLRQLLSTTGTISPQPSTPQPSTPQPSTPQPSTPTISVSNPQPQNFLLQGSGFLPGSRVTIRVADDFLNNVHYQASATSSGSISINLSIPCSPGQLYFSATDSRENRNDLTGVLWSNTVTRPCQ
ncbi:hypothetical protein GLO73106DRAFT_00002890 [Gloeocapsa sp. PCC 73106]|nr:hypothetical protein GLO73106DRAFT_00002890 [Gloeocapsa sp. PCC 73106]